MSLEETIQQTIKATSQYIRAIIMGIPKILMNTAHLFKQALRSLGLFFIWGLRSGELLGRIGLEIAKEIFLNFPDFLKSIYHLSRWIVRHIFDILKFFFYTTPKFFLTLGFNIAKELVHLLVENFADTFKALIQAIPQLIAHAIGITLGIILAPFIILGEWLKNDPQNNQKPYERTQCNPEFNEDALFETRPVIINQYNHSISKHDDTKTTDVEPQNTYPQTPSLNRGMAG